MTEAQLNIKQWGNNLGVRLPVAIVHEAHLHVNQRVCIRVKGKEVVILPAEAPLTLEQRLACFDPTRHGGEIMVCKAIGKEQW